MIGVFQNGLETTPPIVIPTGAEIKWFRMKIELSVMPLG
jgi:hypothetical protein